MNPIHTVSLRMRLLILGGMTALYFLSYFQRVAVPGTIFNELQMDYGAAAGAITGLGALFLYVYGFFQVAAGLSADRFGAFRTLLAGGLVMTFGALCFPFARSLPGLYATRILTAFGASFIFISLIKGLDTLLDRRHFAMGLSVALFFGYAGGLFATWPLERMVYFCGWRRALAGVGTAGAAVWLANFLLLRKRRPPAGGARLPTRGCLAGIARNPRSWFVVAAGALDFSIYFLFQASIGKKLLSDTCGLDSAHAASVLFLMLMISMVATSLVGFASRLMGNRRKPILIGGTTLMLAATAALTWLLGRPAPAPALMVACYAAMALASAGSPLYCSLIKEVNHADAAATSVGFSNCLCYLGVALFSNLAGTVMDAFRGGAMTTHDALIYPAAAYRAILWGCVAAAAAAWSASLFLTETRGGLPVPPPA